jgi:hypothetical protein
MRNLPDLAAGAWSTCRRSARTGKLRSGRETPSSKHRKLARKRSCGRGEPQRGTGGRKEGATQGVHGTSKHAGDCAPTGSLRWVERRTSVNRSPCGRRTSLLNRDLALQLSVVPAAADPFQSRPANGRPESPLAPAAGSRVAEPGERHASKRVPPQKLQQRGSLPAG